jgi:ABC-2 type transport system ATP-binding protein
MIQAQGLSKRYGDTVAVDGLTFDIRPGVVTGFLGPNGAGKSTTMRLVLGLDHPTTGSVLIDGRRYRDLAAPMREVGPLLDAGAVNGRYTARQYLRWLAQAGGLPRGRVDEVLREVGLVEVAGRRLGGYSLGMAQRLGIAAALLGDPATLLFDEPMNGLDPDGIRWIRTLLQRFAAEGRTVVVSSHLMHEMEATADHVLVIGRGRLIADTSIAEFTQRAAGGHVRVVSPDAAALGALLVRAGGRILADEDEAGGLQIAGLAAPAIGDLAAAHGLRLHELVTRRASLENAFMELTRDSIEYTPEALS